LRYTNGTLGIENFDGNEKQVVVVYKKQANKINSYEQRVLTVYDLLGKTNL
jgi:hypothetical protein